MTETVDFTAHNDEIRRVWDAYRAGRPVRVPVTFSLNTRMLLVNPALNPKGITPRRFFEDPAAMWEMELAFHRWMRFEVPQDAEMGLPEAWPMAVNFFNSYEAGWFGCELFYPEGDIADTIPMFRERKERLYDTPLPDPLKGNLMGRALLFHEYMKERAKRETFEGRPVVRGWLPTGTDGPLTAACNLRGATEVCEDLVEDPKYFHDLMAWVTDGIRRRMRAWKELAGEAKPGPGDVWGFADDSIALLSVAAYREHVLPYHRKIAGEFRGEGRAYIHLCGDAQRHFATIVAELGAGAFEVGFPTDMARARRELGPSIELIGNIHPRLLRDGPPATLVAAVRDLCGSGVMEGGRFILREGNNVAPGTPVEHFAAMYEAGKAFGRYS
jgi:hypothetical protein